MLERVLPLLRSWSDQTQEIEAVDVLADELALYHRLGFMHLRAWRCYVIPTGPCAVAWPDGLAAERAGAEHVPRLAELFHASFQEYPEGFGLGDRSLEDWVKDMERMFAKPDVPDACRRASTLVRDAATGTAAGVCIVRSDPSITRPGLGYAKVAMFGVHPNCRRRGLGKCLIRRAQTALAGEYPTLKANVAVGNEAEGFYHKIGCLPGVPRHRLVLRPGRKGVRA